MLKQPITLQPPSFLTSPPPSAFADFEQVVRKAESAARRALSGKSWDPSDTFSTTSISASFRKEVAKSVRQDSGAFFTGPALGTSVVAGAKPSSVVCDPACGVGDLLIPHATRMPLGKGLGETLEMWGDHLRGVEMQEEFLRLARSRLILSAAGRHGVSRRRKTLPSLKNLFPNLEVGDGLASVSHIELANYLVMNPPFIQTTAPTDCAWGRGRVSSAALFVEHCLCHAKRGAALVAILPDVLRSGSRYAEWRRRVETLAEVVSIETMGRFDDHADVDVFVLRLRVLGTPRYLLERPTWVKRSVGATFGQFFDISVGARVPFRATNAGDWRFYLDVSRAEPWGEVRDPSPRLRFEGTAPKPPFVVVRRTSSPQDRARAIATLVTGRSRVVVENHLIVLKPNNGTVELCRRALELLKHPTTTRWLNKRIRCRHLTVGAVADIPWKEARP